jgi:uracil-DNA glycosylase family 4
MLNQRRRKVLANIGIDYWVSRKEVEVEVEQKHTCLEESDLILLEQQVRSCTKCQLHKTRVKTVFGVGDDRANLMIVGEAPGAQEDKLGEPFVGKAGQLLDRMLRAIGLRREQVYIANVLKCRPPENRDPDPSEILCCKGYLESQIVRVAPSVILAVGRVAAHSMLGTDDGIGQLRSNVHSLHSLVGSDIPVVVTYHPAYLLRSPLEKSKVWIDLKKVVALLEDDEA